MSESPEPVGTLAEEAAKLFAAVQAWGGERAGAEAAAEESETAEQAQERPPHRHSDESAGECRWCPLCRLARMAKATSPEVRDHLAQAALSLALAVKALLEDPDTSGRRTAPFETVDVTDEEVDVTDEEVDVTDEEVDVTDEKVDSPEE